MASITMPRKPLLWVACATLDCSPEREWWFHVPLCVPLRPPWLALSSVLSVCASFLPSFCIVPRPFYRHPDFFEVFVALNLEGRTLVI